MSALIYLVHSVNDVLAQRSVDLGSFDLIGTGNGGVVLQCAVSNARTRLAINSRCIAMTAPSS